MMNSVIVRIVDLCARFRWTVIVLGTLLMLGAAAYDVARFSVNTDVEGLISQSLPWHRRQLELSQAFPQKGISAVVRAPTAENAEQATNALAQALAKNPKLFPLVGQPDSGDFFERNGLLFDDPADVKKSVAGLTHARPLLSVLAGDPSLRGVMQALTFAAQGVAAGKLKIEQLAWPLSLADRTLNDVLSGKPATFSWQELLQGHALPERQLQHFVEIQPALDFKTLQPGRLATEGIHRAAADLDLAGKFGAKVDLTGQVPMNDDQFSVIRHSALRDTLTAVFGVLIILWLALRSWKIIGAVFFSLMVGLAATAALGLALVGSFNLISIAFFVLFVGLGVDFGIQFSVRYRSERHEHGDLREALRSAARKAGDPLALAAAATAVGFFAFLPTSYRGLSELGLIAGCGMLIAFICSITLVPAMLSLLNPPGEVEAVGFKGLAPLDDFLQRHRIAVIAGTVLLVLAGSPLLLHLPFDFNPVNLQSPELAFGRDLSRVAEISANQWQRCRGPGAVDRSSRRDRQTPGGASRSFEHLDAAQLYSDRPGAEDCSVEGRGAQPERCPQSVETAARPERPGSGRGNPDRLRRTFQGRRQRNQFRRRGRPPCFRSASASRQRRFRYPRQGCRGAGATARPRSRSVAQKFRAPDGVDQDAAAGSGQGLGIAGRPGPRSGDPEG